LIFGITGQDGAYLAKLLLDKGYEVYGTTRRSLNDDFLSLQFLGIKDEIKLSNVDVANITDLRQYIESIGPDEIYNLAAQSSVGKSFVQPYETINYNTISTLNLLEIIRTNPEIKFYQASSSEMFGMIDESKLPLTESNTFHPLSPYAVSKASSHWATVNYRESYNLKTACGILFNHESALRGKDFVTKKIISTALLIKEGKAKELRLGNLDVYRDWGYAPDYVKAMWLILQQESFEDYLICSGQASSLKDFVEKVFEKLSLNHEDYVIIDPKFYRPVDLKVIYGTNEKAKSKLNWRYDKSFDDLIETLIEDELKLKSFYESLS